MTYIKSSPLISPTKLTVIEYSGDTTSVVGLSYSSQIIYTSSVINSNITEVTDIHDPENSGGWTTYKSIYGKYEIIPTRHTIAPIGGNGIFAGLRIDYNDNLNNALRLQLIKDDIIIADIIAIQNPTSSIVNIYRPEIEDSGTVLMPFMCNKNFIIRFACKGTFINASSAIGVAKFYYSEIE